MSVLQNFRPREDTIMEPRWQEDPTLRDRSRVFADRRDAGRRLAAHLAAQQRPADFILAIPAGGVPVAVEIAQRLRAPLELLIVRKVQIPWNTEAGCGAVAPDGQVILNEPLVRALELSDAQIQAQVAATRKNLAEREQRFRRGRPYPDFSGKPLILVDDGLASGYTMLAALRFLGQAQPREILVAVPTGLRDTIHTLITATGAEVLCLNVCSRRPFAVAAAYLRWYDVPEDEVLQLLAEFLRREGDQSHA